MKIELQLHANIWSDGIHILCPPRRVKEIMNILLEVPEIDLIVLPSAGKEEASNDKSE